MSLKGANYVQDFPKFFFEVKQPHVRKFYFKRYYVCKEINEMEIYYGDTILFLGKKLRCLWRM